MPTLKEQLEDFRAVAERLPLGEAGDRVLRGLFVDLVDIMLGREALHPDVTNAGVRVAPPSPEKLGIGVPPATALVVAPGTKGGPATDPAGDTWLAQAQAGLRPPVVDAGGHDETVPEYLKRKKAEAEEAAAAAAAAPAKDPTKAAATTPNGGH